MQKVEKNPLPYGISVDKFLYMCLNKIKFSLELLWTHCIPKQKSGILRIQYDHATAATAEISFQTR